MVWTILFFARGWGSLGLGNPARWGIGKQMEQVLSTEVILIFDVIGQAVAH